MKAYGYGASLPRHTQLRSRGLSLPAGNEEYVGKAVRESIKELGIPRKDIYITTKLTYV